jgi:broad specificity phosphatase PhoE
LLSKPIIVVRHAHPADSHVPKSCDCHWFDSALSELGIQQAACAAERLKADLAGEPVRIWSSDLRRAAQTAGAIGQALGVPVRTTPDLREYKSSLSAEANPEELYQYVPRDSQPTKDILADRAAESWAQFYNRVSGRMAQLVADGDDRLLIVVAHYGANMNILDWWLGIGLTPDGDTPVAFETTLASITVLKGKPSGKHCLERLNDVLHLHAAGLTEGARLLSSPKAKAAPESAAPSAKK